MTEVKEKDVENHKMVKKMIDKFGKAHNLDHSITETEDEVILLFFDKGKQPFGTITLKKKK